MTRWQRRFRFFLIFATGMLFFIGSMKLLEYEGVPRPWLGYFFLFSATFLYAGIGLAHRTSQIDQFFVAGRNVPAVFNGMATAADWISAASFISLVGGLYLHGFAGLAYLLGWTGGYCLLAFLIAPYLRKFGQYTVADFLAARYAAAQHSAGLDMVRMLAALATILICFTYVIAQIYAVGLITSRFTGVDFATGIFIGLASILVCSFLGGMHSITWTQIVQYLIILCAFAIPVGYLAFQHGDTPLYYADTLHKLEQAEQRVIQHPSEAAVRAAHARQAEYWQQQLQQLPASWEEGRNGISQALAKLRQGNGSLDAIRALERELANYPKSARQAAREWQRAYHNSLQRAQVTSLQATPQVLDNAAQKVNFIALVFCLMLGTAALPHILMRSYTTRSVQATRNSIFWSLLFIVLLYLLIPPLAAMLKYEILTQLAGRSYSQLPAWVSYWSDLEHSHALLEMVDMNHDGIVQFGEIWIDGDILVLASPEIAGLPYVFSALIAAGALAAALSSADGLLLAISSALSHDVYYHQIAPQATPQTRVTLTKLLLLIVAFLAAYAASTRPADILSLVGAAFSLAASSLLPVLVAAIFWRRASRIGAISAMLCGFSVCLYYLIRSHPALGGGPSGQWWHISAAAAGVFGVPAASLTLVVVSWLTPAPCPASQKMLENLRQPD